MNIQLISRVETITPMLAEEYLKSNKNNRQLRKNIVAYYASQMRDGQWMLNGEAIIFNERGTLVDGQHRLAAVIEAGVNIDMLVVRNADKDSFATIDSGISRKITDTFYVKGIPNATNVAAIISRYCKLRNGRTAMGVPTSRKESNTPSRQDLLKIYSDNEDFWQDVCKFANCCYRPMRLMKATEIGGVVSFLILDKGHSQDIVMGFFEDLLIADLPKSKMLAAYRKKLISDMTSTTHLTAVYKQQLLIKVWNAYVDGREFTLMRWTESLEGKRDFI